MERLGLEEHGAADDAATVANATTHDAANATTAAGTDAAAAEPII